MEAFLNNYLLRVIGAILLIPGLVVDCCIGILLLSRMEWSFLLLHFPIALCWAVGVNLVSLPRMPGSTGAYINKWGLTALLPAIFTFPGLWPLVYSFALMIAWYTDSGGSKVSMMGRESKELPTVIEASPTLESIAQPCIDTLHNTDTQGRLSTVAKLSHYASPGTTHLLRQLLSDPKAEIRSRASIALTRLEGELSRSLNASFERWSVNPSEQENILALADQYYLYARSNVLDHVSQRFYLEIARDLLCPVLARDNVQDARLWMKLARIRQELGEIAEALSDVRRALEIQPGWQEASILAMELAFRLHSWETFVALTDKDVTTSPAASRASASLKALQWWTTLHASLPRDVRHD